MAALSFAVAMVLAGMASGAMPCLPNQLEFQGSDTMGRHSYNALDFNLNMYGMKREDFHMIKDHAKAKRYDITPTRCDVFSISNQTDFPQCVPDSATQVSSKHGPAWSFRNVDGATLLYSTSNPSTVYEKISPNGSNEDTYMNSHSSISDNTIFQIPASCTSIVG